jgi:UPF0716 protein FxsA
VHWLLIFLLVPVIEIYLFIEVGSRIGFFATIGLCFLTAIIGSWIVRSQGIGLLVRAQSDLNQGVVPARAMGEGAMVSFAGMLLIVPGFFTDLMGFLLLIPFVRRAVMARIGRNFRVAGGAPSGERFDGPIIEGEAHEIRPGDEQPANENSPWRR